MIKLAKENVFLGFSLSIALLAIFQPSEAVAQCSLIDNSRDSLFITYERLAEARTNASDTVQDNVLLRLKNNSTCAVLITSGSSERFLKPLPPNATALQRVRREIDHDLPDNAFVPELQYSFCTGGRAGKSVGGDMFFTFRLLPRRSIVFEVPLEHFNPDDASKIKLKFQYSWEQEDRATRNFSTVENIVHFWVGDLPGAVKAKIPGH